MRFTWINHETNPMKVKTLLAQHGVTRSLLKKVKFHGGAILVDERPVLAIHMLTGGETVTMVTPAEIGNDHLGVSTLPIDILYEDRDYLIVNKPAGVASVPAHALPDNTLANRVKGYYQAAHYDNEVVHITTRLDRDTSGIVLFAKHHFAHSIIDHQLKAHAMRKMYLAVVSGELTTDHGWLDASIGRAADSFIKRTTRPDGKPSLTEYWVVKRLRNMTVVRVRLHTGRTHQIRVHFAASGHPLIGDALYGGPRDPWIQRQALHCMQLEFDDPFISQTLTTFAPLPADLNRLIIHNQRANS
ncbi:RluA family pseudouridine synthase [Lactiplantibacillus plantarum]|uniref:RluA family pseudouridine synthase n=1 Tax=Lactiplantibacillus plantarum TaxID=1590 RepID=UPI002468BEA9|nr:RluA family pseudouridine synthase [Lactiplantibacillus plantarum]MDH5112428.1 RluA family pseudouridine synthase [Lactiplantibacillus plantarum]